MEWIKGIQRALDYVEAHLQEEIDYEAAVRPPFIFREYSGSYAAFRWGIISV